MKKFYITTPIFYPSGKPHLGHAFSALYASLLTEYKRLIGYDAYFATGTDEHGQKIEEVAKKEGITPIELVNRNSSIFEDLWNTLGIKYDYFVRTTNNVHIDVVQKTFEELLSKGYIYLDVWKGLYCVSCEENYNDSEVVNKDGILFCKQGHKLVEKNEESYFLKIKLFNKWVIDLLSTNKDFIFPQNRAKELINNFLIDEKLEDLSITRTTFNWGIKTLTDSKHVIYVWLDALLSYIALLGYKSSDQTNFNKYWLSDDVEKVHLIGKEITRFHCIYWPIILKMLDVPLPDKIISHGWIITETGKMSKSLGNVINPFEIINKYGRDSFRYFLAKEISIKEDSVFSEQKLIVTFNTDLANNYGNLVNRTIGMLKKYNNNVVPSFTKPITNFDIQIVNDHMEFITKFKEKINQLNIKELIELVCEFENKINNYIEQSKPWNFIKNNSLNELNSFLSILVNLVRTVIYCLSPILIDATKIAVNQLNFTQNLLSLDKLLDYSLTDNIVVNEASPIFVRIEN